MSLLSVFSPLLRRVSQFKTHRRKIHSYGLSYSVLRHCWAKRTPVFSSSCRTIRTQTDKESIDLSAFPPERIRNFCIIAHIDHGKSTLADRLLEMTGAIAKNEKNKQVLDKLQVERERGITVKAQTASLFYSHQGEQYLLNLIDTPGHVDFSYEVSRSISACQGVLLIVDANQGIQAQTVANFYLAFEAQLSIIPVINKIDLKNADPERVESQIEKVFDIPSEECIRISAKLGTNVERVLQAVVDRIPPPVAKIDDPFTALVFDSDFDHYRGVVANIAVFGGQVRKGDKVVSAHLGKTYDVNELGLLRPNEHPTQKLFAGQVGYIVAGMKDVKEAQIGDTLYLQKQPVEALPGFKPAKPMVFAGMYPMDQSEYPGLRSAIERLTLNDSSVTVQKDSSLALGAGWRLGFLGLLHMEVFNQRLEQEYNASVIVTAPTVPYKAVLSSTKLIKEHGSEEITVVNPAQFPDRSVVSAYLEPMVLGTILAPDAYTGKIMSICANRRAVQKNMVYIDDQRVMMKYLFPLNEIVVDFYDLLKSMSSGYASFDYENAGYQAADLIKMDILLNGRPVEELTTIVHRERAYASGKAMCERLKDSIPRQMFEIAVQAAIGSKILARETIKAYRKNVLAKCYGGDITRKMKLLKKQAEGKKKKPTTVTTDEKILQKVCVFLISSIMGLEAWFMDTSDEDQRKDHKMEPNQPASLEDLGKLGVFYRKLNADIYESDPKLEEIRKDQGYSYMDIITIHKDTLPNYEEKLKTFFTEHLHTDDEIRYVLDGRGYFDVRDHEDRWIRIATCKGDLISLPAGIYHRFTLDETNYIKAMRLFVGEPVWKAHNRPADDMDARTKYIASQH